MKPTRRRFLHQCGFAAAGLLLSRPAFSLMPAAPLTGLQLYCVRADMKQDPAGTLKALAAMGYRYVEHANYVDGKFYGHTPQAFKALLDSLGLKMPSGHTVLNPRHWDNASKDFTDVWKKTVEDAAYLGQQYVISPWLDNALRKDYDALLKTMELFNKCGELCRKYGMQFGYHNHDFEFSESLNGRTLYDIILQETDPKLVMQQLDTGNLYNGGAQAADIVKRYPGRFASLHVKDEILATEGKEKYESTILGKGIVPLRDILKTVVASQPGVHLIIEQESYQGKAPLDCMREDLEVMRNWGYA